MRMGFLQWWVDKPRDYTLSNVYRCIDVVKDDPVAAGERESFRQKLAILVYIERKPDGGRLSFHETLVCDCLIAIDLCRECERCKTAAPCRPSP
jgi:hypothetical protein